MAEGKLKVYYNSACPVCDAGIRGQRGRMEACKAQADWIDIHQHPEALAEIGAPQELVRERLYLMDESGEILIGADAFQTLWSRTDGQRWLARIVTLPVLHTLSCWTYNGFARLLYAWNRLNRRW